MAAPNDEAPGGLGTGLQGELQQGSIDSIDMNPGLPVAHVKKFSSKSTATKAQIERLISLISIRPHHTHELRQLGISHPAGRIGDLEKLGFVFDTDRITTVDSDGYPHSGVALYALVSIPAATQHTTSKAHP